jgi:enoyl-CoA hydratase/carnithine racemase
VIDVQRLGPVAVVRLDHGKVNALDDALLDELVESLDAVERSDARAVVLTGAGRVFSAGVDLQKVLDGGPAYLERLIPALSSGLGRLFASPLPIVAAVNGAAVAGGCILACACDRRLLAEGARIGASELLVGVPFPVAALEILRWACGDRTEEVVLSGKLYASDEAVQVGLAHDVVASADLFERAVAVAATLGAVPAETFRLAKSQLRRPAVERIAADGPVVDPEVLAVWSSPRTAEALRAQMDKTARRN